jgi:hypothetical protein
MVRHHLLLLVVVVAVVYSMLKEVHVHLHLLQLVSDLLIMYVYLCASRQRTLCRVTCANMIAAFAQLAAVHNARQSIV